MISFSIKRFSVLLALLCIVMLAGCGKNSSPQTNTIRVGYLPVTSGLPLFVGIEKGYFQAEGLTIDAQVFQTSNQLADALLAQRLDMDAGTSSFVLASLSQEPDRLALLRVALMVEVDSTRWVSRLIVPSASPIRSVQDLRAQKEPPMIGCFPGIAVKTFTNIYFQSLGTWSAQAQLTELPPPAQAGALTAGSVQAVMALEPMGSMLLATGQCREIERAPIERHVLGTWAGGYYSFAEPFVINHSAQANAMLRALDKAIRFIEQSPDSAKQYLKKYASLNNDTALAMTPIPYFRFPSSATQANLDKVGTVLHRAGVLKSPAMNAIRAF